MTFTTAEARDRIIGDLEAAEEELGLGIAALGEAFELLATGSADRLEDDLFRPVQKAYVRTKRTRTRAIIKGETSRASCPGTSFSI